MGRSPQREADSYGVSGRAVLAGTGTHWEESDMGMLDYIYAGSGLVATLAGLIGGLVVDHPPRHSRFASRAGLFPWRNGCAVFAVTFGATSPTEPMIRNVAVAISGAVLGGYFYVMLAWINAKIRGSNDGQVEAWRALFPGVG